MVAKITTEKMQNLFDQKQIWSSQQLIAHFDCTFQCLWRNLRHIKYFTSYTHNAKYFTIANIPEFDKNGIWFFDDPVIGKVGFTKYFSANKLIVSLITSSTSGMCENEISAVTKIRVFNQLNTLSKKSIIKKLKLGGRYRYFSNQEQVYKKQYNIFCREQQPPMQGIAAPDSSEVISAIEKKCACRIKKIESSRDLWNQRSNEKQENIRSLLIRVRDLERSRDKWKLEAKDYQDQIHILQAEIVKKNFKRKYRSN